jgi:putative oxidoreductase
MMFFYRSQITHSEPAQSLILWFDQTTMNLLSSSEPFGGNRGLGVIRIIVGLLLVYHGHEIFRPEIMKSYLEWDMFKGSWGSLKVYSGKAAELIAGVSLTLGWYTRMGALLLTVTLGFITFFVGHGRFWYEDQHPFMFVLFGLLFFLMGPGSFSLDAQRKKS